MKNLSQFIINNNTNYNNNDLFLNKNKKNFYINHIHNFSNDNKDLAKIKSNDNTFHYPSNYEEYLKLDAKSFKNLVNQKKITFRRISNSISQIIKKHSNDSLTNVYYKAKTNPINIKTNININNIAEHLLKIYSKHELNLINKHIDYISKNKEETEKKNCNKKKCINNPKKTQISSHNKKNILKKSIKNNSKVKPIKIKNANDEKKNSEDINFSDDEDINFSFKPEFYTYIKCKANIKNLSDLMTKKNKNIRKNTLFSKTADTSNSKRDNKTKIKGAKIYKKNSNKLFKSTNKNHDCTLTPIIYRNKTELKYNKKKNYSYCTSENNSTEKYINHKYDYIKSIYRNDSELFKRVKEQNEKKIKKLKEIKRENEMKEIEECTFSPLLNKSKTKKSYDNKLNNKPNISNDNYKYVNYYKMKNNKKQNLSKSINISSKNSIKKRVNDGLFGNNKIQRNFSKGKNKENILYLEKKENKSFIKQIKEEDKEKFLVLHKLLIDNHL